MGTDDDSHVAGKADGGFLIRQVCSLFIIRRMYSNCMSTRCSASVELVVIQCELTCAFPAACEGGTVALHRSESSDRDYSAHKDVRSCRQPSSRFSRPANEMHARHGLLPAFVGGANESRPETRRDECKMGLLSVTFVYPCRLASSRAPVRVQHHFTRGATVNFGRSWHMALSQAKSCLTGPRETGLMWPDWLLREG
jgi:hypothetical protein